MNDEIGLIVDRWERTGTIAQEDLARIEALRTTDRRRFRALRPLIPLMRVDAGMESKAVDVEHEIDISDEVMDRIESEGSRFGRRRGQVKPSVAVAAIALLVATSVFGALRIGNTAPDGRTVIVQFQLSAPEADSVALVGDFNEWEPEAYQLTDPDGDGVWEIEVELEQDRVYTYNFLIDDDEWISDPSARSRVEDSFGGEKSVLNL